MQNLDTEDGSYSEKKDRPDEMDLAGKDRPDEIGLAGVRAQTGSAKKRRSPSES